MPPDAQDFPRVLDVDEPVAVQPFLHLFRHELARHALAQDLPADHDLFGLQIGHATLRGLDWSEPGKYFLVVLKPLLTMHSTGVNPESISLSVSRPDLRPKIR